MATWVVSTIQWDVCVCVSCWVCPKSQGYPLKLFKKQKKKCDGWLSQPQW
jgi:hypothetical protein